MDIARPSQARKKKIRRIAYGAGGLLAVLLITLGLSRLKPAAPSVERATLLFDKVKRGELLRNVRGLGTLVPEEIRWIAATTEGRVERIVIYPGTSVNPDSVILELSNPELEMNALEAESQLRASEAAYTELKVRLESQRLDQQASAARVQADYNQARLRADVQEELAKEGLVARLDLALSKVAADELQNRDRIEKQRLDIGGESITAQLAVQEAQVEQRRAMARLRRSQFQVAMDEFRLALDGNPEESEHHAMYAWSLWMNASDKDKVLAPVKQVFARALELNDRCVPAYFYLGHIYNYQQDYPRALAQFQRALSLRPNYVDAEREIRLLEMRRQKSGGTLTPSSKGNASLNPFRKK